MIERSSRKIPGIKRPYYKPPTNTSPENYRCITLQIPDDYEHIAVFKDALDSLGWWFNYQRTTDRRGKPIADIWRNVVENIDWDQTTCGPDVADCDDGCTEIGPFHPAITYTPNHPILQPSYEGEYAAPVWRTGGGLFLGSFDTDAVVDPAAWLDLDMGQALAVGLPSLTVNFSGTGEIDMTFVGQIQGGMAWVFPDGNPLQGDLVDLQHVDLQEVLSFEALLNLLELVLQGDVQIFDVVYSRKFDTPGPHTLTAWMIPVGEVTFPYAGLGGGLRSVQLCGDITLEETAVLEYTLDAQQDGSVRLLAGGVPVSTVDLRALLDDDYVNVEGDTMSGPLNIYPTSSTVMRLGDASQGGVITVNKSSWFLSLISKGAGIITQLDASNSYTFLTTAQGWRWFPSNSLRAQIDALGRMIATDALYANKLSSTTAWRNAIDMVAGWIDSTDATRLSSMSLGVYNWANRQEIMQAWATDGTESPYLAFRGEIPVAMPLLTGSTLETALGDVVAALVTQGLMDGDLAITEPDDLPPDIPDSDGEVPELDSLRRCRAVTYVLSIVTAYVNYVIDNLAFYSWPELISGMLDELDIPVDATIQVAAYFQLIFTTIGQGGLDGLKSDISDALNDLTSAVYSEGGTLSKSQVLAAIYNALEHPSQDDIYAALDIVISSITFQQWETLYARGVVIPTGFICEEFPVAPCEGFVDYRFDAAWDTEYDGTLVPGFGLQSVNHQPADLNYAVSYLQFQGCGSTRFTIDWWSSDSTYDNVVWGLQTWNSGTQQWDGGVTTPLNGAGVGDNTGIVEIGTGMGDTHRFVVQTQAGPPPHNSFIVRIEWEEYAP